MELYRISCCVSSLFMQHNVFMVHSCCNNGPGCPDVPALYVERDSLIGTTHVWLIFPPSMDTGDPPAFWLLGVRLQGSWCTRVYGSLLLILLGQYPGVGQRVILSGRHHTVCHSGHTILLANLLKLKWCRPELENTWT